MLKKHTNSAYEAELDQLRDKILLMGGYVEEAIAQAMEALKDRDSEKAKRVISRDKLINTLELEIDELCVELLALRQPAGSDLRLIITGLKISTDLERMGDLVVNLCERVIELSREPLLKPLIDLPHMANLAMGMVREALDAYVKHDASAAKEVCERDDEVDNLDSQIVRELLTYMMEKPGSITRGLGLIMVTRYLERIADHATNISEMVIFLVKGKDVRHRGIGD
ncbi:MAG: phosphate transport system regulatory protein PhoU [Deltaproteobacteria bacterium]|nr:MAG: phosphate transport system regulatory protein PhoU [Deltaproteobacteria bacterium]